MSDTQRALEDEHFLALVSIKYHKARMGFFEGLSRWINFISLVTSSAAVVAIVDTSPQVATLLAGFVAILQALALIVQPGGKATVHAGLAARHAELERMTATAKSNDQLDAIRRLRSEVEQDEPPVKWWLGLKMHNEVLLYQRGSEARLYDIPVMQKGFLSHLWDWNKRSANKEHTVPAE